jgi:NAD(P)-dependent dehydrogenase (short-subunit alcohol dehydrogenase family)
MTSKVALVTAAGSGLGAGIAKELSAQGWRVAVSSSSGKGEALGKSLGGLGFTASNEDPAALERVVKGTLDAWGRIDALVNSSGHPPKGDLLAISDADWHRGLDMILLSVVRLSRLVTPAMEKQGGGAIVNVSTFAAFEPDLAFPVSCALRAALGSFAKLYSDRYAKANIRMNNVLPGFFDSLAEKEAAKQRVPLGRYGKVEELAKTVAFLVSDGAGYIAGQNLRVDGGITRGV